MVLKVGASMPMIVPADRIGVKAGAVPWCRGAAAQAGECDIMAA